MDFSEPFQTVALGLLSYMVGGIINYMIIFILFSFNFHKGFTMVLRRKFFEIFGKLQ